MSEIKLLPCPFCGGEASLTKKNRIIVEGKTERECHVHCNKCNARAERVLYKSCSTTEMAHELARKLWNTRKPMERILTRLEEYNQSEDDFKKIIDTNREIPNPTVSRTIGRIEAFNKAIEIVKEEGGIE